MSEEAATPEVSARWVLRPTVLDRCAAARLVLVEAPGGWGKSTLAEQIAERAGSGTCWVRVTGPTSVDDLTALVARGWRRAGVPEIADLVAAAPDASDAADQVVGALARRREPITVVVDDAHELDDAAASWLRSLIDDVRVPHRVVVCARETPRALTRRLPAGAEVVDVADLRFTATDVGAVMGTDDPAAIDEVLRRTDGWPTAVRLAAAGHRLPSGDGADDLLVGLVDEVLGDDVARVAPLAWLPRLSPASCAPWPGAFDRLRTSGLPMTRHGDWWALADPVREVLRTRGSVTSHEAAAVARHHDAATATSFLSNLGFLDELAAHLASRPWRDLEDMSVGQLTAALDALGPQRRTDAPRAVLAVARAIESRDTARRREVLASCGEVSDPAVRHEIEAENLRESARHADMETVLSEAPRLVAELGDDELVALGRALQSLGIANAYSSTPESLVAADAALTRAAGIFELIGERAWQADALRTHAIMVSYHGGRVALAAEQLSACLALMTPGSRPWAIALTYIVEILLDLGRDAEAEAAARSALDVGQRTGDATVTSYATWSMAIVACNKRDLDGTRRWLDEVERTPGTWMQDVSGQEFLSFGADLLAALGDREGAMVYRDRCAAMADQFGTHSMIDVVDGRIEAMYGDPARAIEIFERLDGEPYATIRARWVRTLFRALAAKRSGDRTAATAFVARALDLVGQMGLPDLPQRSEPLVVQMLADVWPGGPDAPVADALRVNLLGGFVVLSGTQTATPAPGHPATLVKLLALRGTVTVEQAIDALWPDADLTTGRQRLRNLLNRLRSQSGPLVERDAETLRLASSAVIDVDHFDAAVDAAFAAPAVERPGLARLALGAYTGDLLPGDPYEDWTAAPRERLRRRYLGLVDIVAADALDRGDLDEGVRLLDLAIEREPLEEHRYVTVAEALVSLGRRSAARDVVERAVAVLDDLGVVPGPDLTRVGRSLDVPLTR